MNEWIDEQRDGLRDRRKKEEAYKTKAHTHRERERERERESPPVTADAKKEKMPKTDKILTQIIPEQIKACESSLHKSISRSYLRAPRRLFER